MSHAQFLLALGQLGSKKRADITFQELPIRIESDSQKKIWTVSTAVYVGEGEIPHSVRACLPSSSMLQWQTDGPYIRIEGERILLEQKIPFPFHFLSFRKNLSEFCPQAEEWKEIFLQPARRFPGWALVLLASLSTCLL